LLKLESKTEQPWLSNFELDMQKSFYVLFLLVEYLPKFNSFLINLMVLNAYYFSVYKEVLSEAE
jgi:hypothetical protein